ncbi:hypothetical protein Bca101_090613 [Brassica carinata]
MNYHLYILPILLIATTCCPNVAENYRFSSTARIFPKVELCNNSIHLFRFKGLCFLDFVIRVHSLTQSSSPTTNIV